MSIQEIKLTEIADAIRAKEDSTDPIVANDFASRILALPTGFDFSNATVDNSNQVLKDEVCYGVDGMEIIGTLEPEEGNCDLENLLGFPEVADITSGSAIIISDETDTFTFNSSGKITVTGGETGTYLLNGVAVDLGVEQDLLSGDNEIKIGSNGKVTTYNTANEFKTFKIIFSNIFSTRRNAEDRFITYSNILYAHIASTGDLQESMFYRQTGMVNTSNELGRISDKLKKLKLSNVETLNNNDAGTIGVFIHCYSLKEIILPNTLTKIGLWAFRDNTGLEKIVIPNSVNVISEQAFTGCTSLKEVNIPSGVTNILPATFRNCSLYRLDLPIGITNFTPTSIEGNNNLKEITNTATIIQEFTYNVMLTNLYNLEEWNFNNTAYNFAISFSCGSATAVRAVKGKLNKFKFSPLSTFGHTSAPQLRITNCDMPKTAIIDVFNQIIATGVTGKTISLIGCVGNADFDTTERADWATATGWTIIW